AECGKWKKQALAPRAARTAREKFWLPERLLAPLEETGAETRSFAAEAEQIAAPPSWADDVNRIIRGEQDMPILADFLIKMFRRSKAVMTVGRGDFRTGLRKFGKDADPNFKLPDTASLDATLGLLGITPDTETSLAMRKVVFYSGIDWADA
ncbi:hypothetical protein, partial [Methylosinus sp. R-45379]|uniref:hypothetical protein n=1 Tax=Methylosinus sp. R-45379 TaxID=980563 RepID=UPI000AAED420